MNLGIIVPTSQHGGERGRVKLGNRRADAQSCVPCCARLHYGSQPVDVEELSNCSAVAWVAKGPVRNLSFFVFTAPLVRIFERFQNRSSLP